MATFQAMISDLQRYWEAQGCTIMQPYHTEVGAGTSNPATFLRVLGSRPWRTGYVEPSIRPDDGRYGENPFRFQQFYQYQVILKPAPPDVQDVYPSRSRWPTAWSGWACTCRASSGRTTCSGLPT
jgi:glycyl-tRNA synthetase alpha chain